MQQALNFLLVILKDLTDETSTPPEAALNGGQEAASITRLAVEDSRGDTNVRESVP
ncbi:MULTISPECIES: hypothetical protein [unclassified Cupriavidus]|uniref:hypothetical protein n=1 Tax=unclassified Cupriavidus TaxID=2640874 RepID=UPI0014053B53|nr:MULTISPECIES: hypothetical protein [unclassified Cupriavidus]MBF6989016.1 hypothetical protein [Cupriavidus sp. IK-TO18]